MSALGDDAWPEFMFYDQVASLYFDHMVTDFADFVLVATDADGTVVARGYSVPFAFGGQCRTELPSGGWDRVVRWAHEHRVWINAGSSVRWRNPRNPFAGQPACAFATSDRAAVWRMPRMYSAASCALRSANSTPTVWPSTIGSG